MTEMQNNKFDLSVIVPIYNAGVHLERLVHDVFALGRQGLNCQMICVDDGSTDNGPTILRDLIPNYPGLTLITNGDGRGAGRARNAGWLHARGRYSLFFDADDLLHGNIISDVVRSIDCDPQIDLAFCAYRYERDETASFTEMSYGDRRIMDRLLAGRNIAIGSIAEMFPLLNFTNYPWNKILRTAHYQKMGMRFGRTIVNNDILGHWHGLLLARRIMLQDAVLCTHIVHPTGNNLTNVLGADRLALFDALEETYDFLEARPSLRHSFGHYFWDLTQRLADEIQPRLNSTLQHEFQILHARLLERLDLNDLSRMRAGQAPALATSLVRHLIR